MSGLLGVDGRASTMALSISSMLNSLTDGVDIECCLMSSYKSRDKGRAITKPAGKCEDFVQWRNANGLLFCSTHCHR